MAEVDLKKVEFEQKMAKVKLDVKTWDSLPTELVSRILELALEDMSPKDVEPKLESADTAIENTRGPERIMFPSAALREDRIIPGAWYVWWRRNKRRRLRLTEPCTVWHRIRVDDPFLWELWPRYLPRCVTTAYRLHLVNRSFAAHTKSLILRRLKKLVAISCRKELAQVMGIEFERASDQWRFASIEEEQLRRYVKKASGWQALAEGLARPAECPCCADHTRPRWYRPLITRTGLNFDSSLLHRLSKQWTKTLLKRRLLRPGEVALVSNDPGRPWR